MPLVDANGVRFNTQVLHGGPAPEDCTDVPRPQVVMLHGLVADNLSSWYYTIANPVAMHADVHLYDLRGHGRSQVPDEGYTVAEQVDDLEALLDAWGVEGPVHLFGNSFGGVLSLAFAHRHPERVASLFLIEAHFPVEGWGEHMAGSLALAVFGLDEDVVQEWLAENADRKLSRFARKSEHLLTKTTLIEDLQRELPISWLREIACPTFAIYGSESDILDRARELEAKVPDCELHIVPDRSHSLLLEESARIRDHAVAWIRRHGGLEPEPT